MDIGGDKRKEIATQKDLAIERATCDTVSTYHITDNARDPRRAA